MSDDLSFLSRYKNVVSKADERIYAVKYTRVSSKKQDKNFSLPAQNRLIDEWAERNQKTIIADFGGGVESAKRDDRKEFQRMLDFVLPPKNRVKYIIVNDLTRFSRTGGGAISISEELLQKGIEIVSVTQPFDAKEYGGKMYRDMNLILANWENEDRKRKTRMGMIQAMRSGKLCCKPPLGYSKNAEGIIVKNELAPYVEQVFILKAKHKLHNIEIVHRLRQMGWDRCYKQLVQHILDNPFYCGYITHELLGKEVCKGLHEPLISVEMYKSANNIQTPGRGHKKNFDDEQLPMKRFARCSHCGGNLTGFMVKKKYIYYYRCNTKGCHSNISADRLHEAFRNHLYNYTIDHVLVEPLKLQLRYTFEEMNAETEQQRILLTRNLTEIDRNIETLEERYVLGKIDDKLYMKFRARYMEERSTVAAEFDKVKISLSNLDKYVDYSMRIASKINKLWELGTYEERRLLQTLLFPDGIIFNKEKNDYQTVRVNAAFALISTISSTYRGQNKNGAPSRAVLSKLAPQPGLEPGTL